MAAAAKTKPNDSQPPHRRGKTESSTNDNNNNKKKKNEVVTAMQDQLNRAQAQVYQNKLSTQVLHLQWKRHLLNLSYLLIVLSLMQLKGPLVTCLQDIKAYNNNMKNQDNQDSSLVIISGIDAIKIICTDSIVPAIAIVMAASLSFFLIQTANITIHATNASSQFSNPRYIFACACIPILLVLSSHVVVQSKKGDKEGCIDDLLQQAGILPSDQEIQQRPSRGFPVVLVFHVILTICLGFMESQMKLHDRRIVQVDNLLQELHDSTSDGGTSSSSTKNGNDDAKSKTTGEEEDDGKRTENKKSK